MALDETGRRKNRPVSLVSQSSGISNRRFPMRHSTFDARKRREGKAVIRTVSIFFVKLVSFVRLRISMGREVIELHPSFKILTSQGNLSGTNSILLLFASSSTSFVACRIELGRHVRRLNETRSFSILEFVLKRHSGRFVTRFMERSRTRRSLSLLTEED